MKITRTIFQQNGSKNQVRKKSSLYLHLNFKEYKITCHCDLMTSKGTVHDIIHDIQYYTLSSIVHGHSVSIIHFTLYTQYVNMLNCFQDENILTLVIKPGWKAGTKMTFPKEVSGDRGPQIQPVTSLLLTNHRIVFPSCEGRPFLPLFCPFFSEPL